jgi:hypothetical protein
LPPFFFNFELSSTSGILPTLSALHAIRKFRLQFDILLPFATALKAISDPLASCRKEFDFRTQCSFIFADFLDFACGS